MMGSESQPSLFQLDIDLERHPRIALGASAGTGKTYTLQALAVRNLIEGHCKIGELLMVTFTKAAAAEMRQRLVNALEQAVQLCDPARDVHDDEPLGVIYRCEDKEALTKRYERAQQALADIDQAVVTTLDSFWAMLVKWLDIAPEGELDLIDEAFVAQSTLHHFLIQAANHYNRPPPIPKMNEGLKVVYEMLNVPKTKLDVPVVNVTSSTAAALGALAVRSVESAKEIRQKSHSYTYSDVLEALNQYLKADGHSDSTATHAKAIQQLIGQFKVVMVDEVQDTNEAQLQLLKKLFKDTDIHLYLVGDPKQAIYEFRGGDINAWDDARRWVQETESSGQTEPELRQTQFELNVNYRSDGPVVEAINTLFMKQRFSFNTDFLPVEPRHKAARISTAAGAMPPCTLRSIAIDKTNRNKDETIVATIQDVVRYCAELLTSRIEIKPNEGEAPRLITPGDICVLVRRNDDIFKLNNALLSHNIPSLMASGNVLQSEAATYWLDLLEALVERPDPGALTALTVGPWLRGTALDSNAIWTYTLVWRQILERYGPGALIEAIDTDIGFAGKLLARPDGRRLLTDLEHVGELLDNSGEWGRRRWAQWLRHARYSYNMRAEEERRRLDLDGGAVELRTAHSAKGLERPIVLVPFAWINTTRQAMMIPRLYYRQDPKHPGRRERYLNLDDTNTLDQTDVAPNVIETAAYANQRLFYVEATRAKHHVAIWHQEAREGLGTVAKLVHDAVMEARSAQGGGTIDSSDEAGKTAIPARNGGFVAQAQELAEHYPHLFAAHEVQPDAEIPTYQPTSRSGETQAPLAPRMDSVAIDMHWRRSSFSGWVQEQDDTDRPTFDEPDVDTDGETAFDDGVAGDAVTLTVMPSGAETGTAVHKIYELLDFQDPNSQKVIRQFLADQLAGPLAELESETLDQVALGLHQVLHTPLGGPLGALTLAKVSRAHRADEIGYEFSVQSAGGPGISLAELGKIWAAHVHDDDPFAAYAKRLAKQGDDRPLRGYLLGFIDLVVQYEHPDGQTTWTVMDYKTNRIAIPGVEVLRQGHYQPGNLRTEMEVHHYPLQSLLYQVALHRYLRASLIGYTPRVHLGGSAYLFVRGMSGEPNATVAQAVAQGASGPGVMWWTPSAALIEAVDAAFAGEGSWT